MIFLLMAVGAYMFSTMFSFFLAHKNFERGLNASFGLISFFIMIYACTSYIKATTGSLDEWIFMEKLQDADMMAATVAILYFLRSLVPDYLPKYFYFNLAVLTAMFIINIVSPYGIALGYVGSNTYGFFMERISLVYVPSVWNLPVVIFIVNIMVFIVIQLLRYYKTGDKKMAVSLLMSLGLISAVTALDMVLTRIYYSPTRFLPECSHLLFIFVVMRWNMVNVLKSGEIKAQLVESEKRHRQIYENSLIGIYRTTPEGEVLMANPSLVKLLGYDSEEDLCSQKLDSMAFYKDFTRKHFLNVMNKNDQFIAETLIVTKDNREIYVRENARTVRRPDGSIEYFEGTFEDITDRKNIERELIKAKETAEQSERIKTDFLAQMSHEIRSPVNTILNFMNLVYEELNASITEEVDAYYAMAVLAGKRLIRSIDQILNMSQLQNGSYKPEFCKLNLNQIVTDVIREHQMQAKTKGIELTHEMPENTVTAVADEYSVNQILSNLIHNAVKYTNKGSVCVKLHENNGPVHIDVIDTGIGISGEYLPNLFKPFTQESSGYMRKYTGNGLGLALAKSYCEINNICIDVESGKGKGSKFSVIFKM
ncbi:MAG: PAS domain-containing sensor histidine kinase [Syntrophothermus sp.]